MCCCPNIKLKYIGVTQDGWINNQIYQVLSVDAAGGIRYAVFNTTNNEISVVVLDASWELVSISVPSETVLFP